MSAVSEVHTTSCVVRAVLLVVCLFVPGVLGQNGAAGDPLAPARAALAEGTAPDSVLAVHAGTLAQAGDVDTLARHLGSGSRSVVAAVLGAVQAHGVVGLVPELVGVAAENEDGDLRRQASEHLESLVLAHQSVRDELAESLADPELSRPSRRQVIVLLGRGRDLSKVPDLLAELDGPLAFAASEALSRLSGFPMPPDDTAASYWPEFWDGHGGLSREVLLELGGEQQRLANERELRRLQTQNDRLQNNLVQLRLEHMDDTVERLIAGLTDEYPAVRLEAARRLAGHVAHEQAQAALPLLLARLGAAADGSNAEPVNDAAVERATEVRAEIVTALGALGRDRPEVLRCLLGQVHADDPTIAGAAVDALANVREQPDMVVPLLAGLDTRAPDDGTLVKVLRIVAANQPRGVLDALRPYLDESRPEEVRRWAVRAVLASAELGQALEEITRMSERSRTLLVRFAMAYGLGDRMRTLPADSPEREPILALLAGLLDDPEASVRAEAASSLGESGAPGALVLLTERARREIEVSVLMDIVEALGDLGDPSAVETIGRIVASDAVNAGSSLAERAQKALSAIGGSAPPSAWLSMAETLRGAGAARLALFAVDDVLFPTRAGATADQSLAERARGLKARLLQDLGRHQDARDLLVQIHEAGGSHPPSGEREELLARSCQALGLADEAADWWTLRLASLEAGDARYGAVRRELALALMATDRRDQALTHLVALSEASPEDNDLMLWIGKMRMAKGEDALAREVFSRLLVRLTDPQDPVRLQAESLLGLLAPVEPPVVPPVVQPAEQPGDEPAVDEGDAVDQPVVGTP